MLLTWVALATLTASAAPAPAHDCAATFDEVVTGTEQNYAGFVVKLADAAAQIAYHRFGALLAARAAVAKSHAQCREVLQAYLGFFADHHLFVISRGQTESPLPALRRHWRPATVRRYLRRQHDVLDRVEGEWIDAAGTLAVLRDNALPTGQWIALRMSGSQVGHPVALLQAQDNGYQITWQHPDLGWQTSAATLHRDGALLAFGTSGWGRAGAAHLAADDPQAPLLQSLGDGVLYLSLPSFMPQYAAALNAIIEEDGARLGNVRTLIVDVRGNAGGDAIYFPLAPYLLSNAIEVSEPSSVLASPWALEYFSRLKAAQGDGGAAWLDPLLARMRAAPGQIVDYQEAASEGLPDYPAHPQQVLVLQDGGVGSAAEAFLFHVRQSAKVVTLGEPSRGNIDYMQASLHAVGGSDYPFWLGCPLYFKRGLPQDSVDDEGYAPDVRLTLPQAKWLGFARQWAGPDPLQQVKAD